MVILLSAVILHCSLRNEKESRLVLVVIGGKNK